jgi:hypothetical protein
MTNVLLFILCLVALAIFSACAVSILMIIAGHVCPS